MNNVCNLRKRIKLHVNYVTKKLLLGILFTKNETRLQSKLERQTIRCLPLDKPTNDFNLQMTSKYIWSSVRIARTNSEKFRTIRDFR